MLKMLLLNLLIVSLFSVAFQKEEKKTLQMVHLLFRHGARSPITYYPLDHIQERDWPDGAGRLTQKGMVMEYELGKFLRQRYVVEKKFINQSYVHRQVRIRSSDSERCLESAEAQLAAFYPPTGRQVWNKNISWQPIPIHTVPAKEDTLLRSYQVKCPRLAEKWAAKAHGAQSKRKYLENEKLMKELTRRTGMNVTFRNLQRTVYDSMVCEKTEGFPQPKWGDRLFAKIKKIAHWATFYAYRGDDELGQLLGGELLGRINENMKTFTDASRRGTLFKLNMFGAHDVSILSLAVALSIDIDIPDFASCMMIELYHSPGKGYTVEILFRNNYGFEKKGVVKRLRLKGCGVSCPLRQFLKVTQKRTTMDRSRLCKSKHSPTLE